MGNAWMMCLRESGEGGGRGKERTQVTAHLSLSWLEDTLLVSHSYLTTLGDVVPILISLISRSGGSAPLQPQTSAGRGNSDLICDP
jgi:hypothetical protein